MEETHTQREGTPRAGKLEALKASIDAHDVPNEAILFTSLGQAAKALGYTRGGIQKIIQRGEFGRKEGGRWMISAGEIRRWTSPPVGRRTGYRKLRRTAGDYSY